MERSHQFYDNTEFYPRFGDLAIPTTLYRNIFRVDLNKLYAEYTINGIANYGAKVSIGPNEKFKKFKTYELTLVKSVLAEPYLCCRLGTEVLAVLDSDNAVLGNIVCNKNPDEIVVKVNSVKKNLVTCENKNIFFIRRADESIFTRNIFKEEGRYINTDKLPEIGDHVVIFYKSKDNIPSCMDTAVCSITDLSDKNNILHLRHNKRRKDLVKKITEVVYVGHKEN